MFGAEHAMFVFDLNRKLTTAGEVTTTLNTGKSETQAVKMLRIQTRTC